MGRRTNIWTDEWTDGPNGRPRLGGESVRVRLGDAELLEALNTGSVVGRHRHFRVTLVFVFSVSLTSRPELGVG